jgi:DNA-binding CsgD family transcriptional regulator
LTLGEVVERTTALPNVDAADIMLLTDDAKELVMVASAGFLWPSPPEHRIDARWAALDRQPRSPEIDYGPDLELKGHHPRWSQFAREGFKTFINIPLHGPARTIGILNMYSRSLVEWDQNRLEFLDTFGGLVAMAVDHAAAPRQRVETSPAARPALSDLDLAILRLVSEGFTNREIAAQVHRSENTVKSRVRSILERTDSANRTDLVRRAVREAWV